MEGIQLKSECMSLEQSTTVDREIFALKIIRVKNYRGVKFSRFVRSAKFF